MGLGVGYSQSHHLKSQHPLLGETPSCPEQPRGCMASPIPLAGALHLHLAPSSRDCPQRISGGAEVPQPHFPCPHCCA